MNQIHTLQIITVLVWIVIGFIVIFTTLNPVETDKNFERTITGLECHRLEQYVLEMEYQWDKVIEYHSFKCSDSPSEFEAEHNLVVDY